jgi:glycerol-3-phosphate dehydrogenase (NAD(P)+)
MQKIGILGAGAFGTSLAISYARRFDVVLFSCFAEHVSALVKTRVNEYFPGFVIPDPVLIDSIENIKNYDFDYILWCFPVGPSLSIFESIALYLCRAPIIVCSKGFTLDSDFLSNKFKKILDRDDIGVLSGPNFAVDIAKFKISSADIAFSDTEVSSTASKNLSIDNFRLFPTTDIQGIQIAGAIKNTMAIACGIVRGIDNSQNAICAFLSHCLAEVSTFGKAMGGRKSTFYGLCGIGDLTLSAIGETSRNTAFGKRVAISGKRVQELIGELTSVCEGIYATKQIIKIAKKQDIPLKISESVYKVLYEEADPKTVLDCVSC